MQLKKQNKFLFKKIGGHLDYKGYGIGLPEGSPHRERFSEIILDLQEKGAVRKINKQTKKIFMIYI
ncbi:unnamed protein product, partial [Rotaria sp. Silwood1]